MFKIDTRQAQIQVDKFIEIVDEMIKNFDGIADETDLEQLCQIKNDYRKQISKFFEENQKITIGVIGQVKAGKSSFLNTLLFDGEEILPISATPKTAILTKMEYSQENLLEIEYYSEQEWKIICDNAVIEIEEDIFIAARELVEMASAKEIDVSEYVGKSKSMEFETYEELIQVLNDYVGEDGRVTAIVKSVLVKTNNKLFKGFTIVDTPGLNDTVISRSVCTKEFLDECDIVFFLSPAGNFLDSSDWSLLFSQLPHNFSNKVVLIGSKFDSALRDVLKIQNEDDMFGMDENKTASIETAIEMVTTKLTERAVRQVEMVEKDFPTSTMLTVIADCKKPILISSIIQNMLIKDIGEYTENERNVFDALTPFFTNPAKELMKIANVDAVKDVFKDVLLVKAEALVQNTASFMPIASEELMETLTNFKNKAVLKSNVLTASDRERLMSQKQEISLQSTALKAAISTIFSECFARLEAEKIKAVRDIRNISKKYNSIQKSVGVQVKTKTYKVSTSEFLKPLTWGSSRTEYSLYNERYIYWSTSDVADDIRSFVFDVSSRIEYIFIASLDPKEMKKKLLGAIVSYADMSNEKYDAAIFKMIITQAVNSVNFPLIKINTSDVINELVARFGGEVTSNSNKAALKHALFDAISVCYESAQKNLEEEILKFKNKLMLLEKEIQGKLLNNVTQEFDLLIDSLESKDVEIDKHSEYIKMLIEESRKLRV
ncbi:dynamin family protein [Candidatus Epulonipiscium viviparus]|uniref:dynamin family protein n=1 Tax=Candidatus Epulonipiscium viviparus TaxID=420336 RepID=UPI002738110F|nr:dynamin family protein [Candidatus Epulopiscium viviparus]